MMKPVQQSTTALALSGPQSASKRWTVVHREQMDKFMETRQALGQFDALALPYWSASLDTEP